jgi:hypothetical protein
MKDLVIGTLTGIAIGLFIVMMFFLFTSCVSVKTYCEKQCADRGEIMILNTPTMVCVCKP